MLNKQEEAMSLIERRMDIIFSPHSHFLEYRAVTGAKYVPFSTPGSFMCSTHIHFSEDGSEESLMRIYHKLKNALFDKCIMSMLFSSKRMDLFKYDFPETCAVPSVKSSSDFLCTSRGICVTDAEVLHF